MSRATLYLALVLAALLLPIVWMIGIQFIPFLRIESLVPIIGAFGLLCAGPLLLLYSLYTYFVDLPIKGKKVLAIVGFISGVLWLSYLLKACVDGEFV